MTLFRQLQGSWARARTPRDIASWRARAHRRIDARDPRGCTAVRMLHAEVLASGRCDGRGVGGSAGGAVAQVLGCSSLRWGAE
eukprot:5942830-Alexandrium_andersonii.AAC.1